jgi:hypothetical protein
VECPPELRQEGDPPSVMRRPPGKERWFRRGPFVESVDGKTCQLVGETFCAPVDQPFECTQGEPQPPIPCTVDAPPNQPWRASLTVPPFVWRDSLGECHTGAAMTCGPGACTVPETPVVSCDTRVLPGHP